MDTVRDMLLTLCAGFKFSSTSMLSPPSTDVGEATRLPGGLGTVRLPAGMHSAGCWKLGPIVEGHCAKGEAAIG
jgi:hypothetical protein